jgi:hypothetical protein
MKRITLGDLRHLKAEDLDAIMPAVLSINGEDKFLMGKPSDMAVIGDLHPHLKGKINALITRARMGMAPVEKVKVEDFKDKAPSA